jgi:hypothetical protein
MRVTPGRCLVFPNTTRRRNSTLVVSSKVNLKVRHISTSGQIHPRASYSIGAHQRALTESTSALNLDKNSQSLTNNEQPCHDLLRFQYR